MTDKYIERDVNVDRQIWERFHYEDSHISKKEVWIGNTYTHRLNYDYDGNGNITSVSDDISGTSVTYTYDKANQLTKAVHSDGREEVYTYDDAGNILTFNNGSGIHRYTYGDGSWGDLLTKYDGQTITYDGIGNPLTDGTWTYTWEHGRELMTMSGGGTTWTYTYDANGMRTKRTNGTTTYSYVYNGGSLSQMTVGSNTLNFAYDASGTPMSVTYNGTNYYYVTNLQGDVIAILNSSGSTVVTYTYDAWGNILTTTGSMATTLGAHNPLRYRGYVCDSETKLYYLSSRYYDPAVGRFINADVYVATGQGLLGNNMFVYCGNNPVVRKDSAGTAYVFLDDSIIDVDPDGSLDEGGSGGGGGFGLGVKPSYYTAQRVQTYDWNWQNSSYNQNPTSFSGTSACFIAGTLVQCEGGTKPIEEIEAGDLVWAYDEETGEVALKEVVETYVNDTSELVHIFVNGEEIITTPAHPFYSPVKGWIDAVHLRAGDILVLVNGEYVVVEKVQHEILEAPVTVYNFQVEDYHTYYVSDVGILVHNSCDYKPLRDGDMRAVINPGELEAPHAHVFQKSNNIGRIFSNGTMDASLLNNRDGIRFVKNHYDEIIALIGDFYGKR